MLDVLIRLLILAISSYGFASAVIAIKGRYLDFKPFNCKFCLSFWFSLAVSLSYGFTLLDSIVASFFTASVSVFLKILEEKPDPLEITK